MKNRNPALQPVLLITAVLIGILGGIAACSPGNSIEEQLVKYLRSDNPSPLPISRLTEVAGIAKGTFSGVCVLGPYQKEVAQFDKTVSATPPPFLKQVNAALSDKQFRSSEGQWNLVLLDEGGAIELFAVANKVVPLMLPNPINVTAKQPLPAYCAEYASAAFIQMSPIAPRLALVNLHQRIFK